MKLLLNPRAEYEWFDEPLTGARIKIKPVSPAQYESIRKKSLGKSGHLDVAKWGENFAVAAIDDWEHVGDGNTAAECSEENKRVFGRNQAVNLMPWVIDQATSLERYRVEEEDAAKKD